MPLKQLAKKLTISEEELYDICRGKINDFSVVRLINYLEKLTLINKENLEQKQFK